MEIIKIESGTYKTKDDKFTIKSDYTSANGGMRLQKCWTVNNWNRCLKTFKYLGQAKDFVRLQYK